MKRTKILPAKAGAKVDRRAGLNLRDGLEPAFRFNDGVFVWRLTPQLRKMLNVDEGNPGIVVILE